MTGKTRFLILSFLVSACGPGEGDRQTLSAPASAAVTSLPAMTRDDARIPYIRYGNTTPEIGPGMAIFLHPMMELRSGFLALDHDTRSSRPIEELFGEELFGASGAIVLRDNIVRVESLPIALPVGVGNRQEWTLDYGRRQYRCRSSSAASEQGSPGALSVRCTGLQHSLAFSFSRDRGVTEFQDFCGDLVCTYRLLDPKGLLSPDVQAHMNLPPIQS